MARFPKSQLHDERREIVKFIAYVGSEQITCEISDIALDDHFGDSPRGKHIDTFIRNRPAIERIAERLIERKRFEPDGSILIRTADC